MISNEETITLTPEKLEKLKLCATSPEGTRKCLLGMATGLVATGLPIFLIKPKVNTAATFLCIGAMYGYITARFQHIKHCLETDVNLANEFYMANKPSKKEEILSVNMYENKKNKSADQELATTEILSEDTKQSIFDIDTSPPMNAFDEFPVISESPDMPEIKEPEKSITYKELRERNREGYKSRNVVQKQLWTRDPSKEQSMQVKERETESKESDFFPAQSAGKSRTKYGDVWD